MTALSTEQYYAQGGRLKYIKFATTPVPLWFECDRLGCPGTVRLKIVIDTTGTPRDVAVVFSTFQVRREEHAEVARTQVQEWRYVPPRLKGRPICVTNTVDLSYYEKGKPVIGPIP